MKRIFFLSLIVGFFLTGCFLDPYRRGNYAEEAIDKWFYYENGEDDLGKTRRKLEDISSIKEKSCEYVSNDDYNRYIYKCVITYTPIGETVIPLSKNEEKTIYVALVFSSDSYTYRVYNSSEKDAYKRDENLNYGKEK